MSTCHEENQDLKYQASSKALPLLAAKPGGLLPKATPRCKKQRIATLRVHIPRNGLSNDCAKPGNTFHLLGRSAWKCARIRDTFGWACICDLVRWIFYPPVRATVHKTRTEQAPVDGYKCQEHNSWWHGRSRCRRKAGRSKFGAKPGVEKCPNNHSEDITSIVFR